MYAINAFFNHNDYSKRFLRLLDRWINDSSCFYERVVFGDIECFLSKFTEKNKKTILYRGICLKNNRGEFNNLSDKQLLCYLQKHGRLFESSTRDLNIAKDFAEMDRNNEDSELSLIVTMEADKYFYLPDETHEKEVVLFRPKYKKIIWKRF